MKVVTVFVGDLEVETARRRFATARSATLMMMGVAVAGLVDGAIAPYALSVTALVWFFWWAYYHHRLRELRELDTRPPPH